MILTTPNLSSYATGYFQQDATTAHTTFVSMRHCVTLWVKE